MQPLYLQDRQGQRYQLCDRGSFPMGNNWQREVLAAGQALPFINRIDTQQLNSLRDKISLCQLSYGGQYLQNAQELISQLLESRQLRLYRQNKKTDTVKPPKAESQQTLYLHIQAELRQILNRERQQAKTIDAQYQKGDGLQKSLSHGKALGKGLLDAGTDLVVWLKEIVEVAHPFWRLKRRLDAALETYEEYARGAASLDIALIQNFLHRVELKDYKELVEALGFDPREVDFSQFSEAWNTAWILSGDATVVNMLTNFSKDYVGAQHSTELTNAAGGAVFEILLTLILAVTTAGIGVAANTASKARHAKSFGRIGEKLKALAALIEKQPRGITKQRKQRVKITQVDGKVAESSGKKTEGKKTEGKQNSAADEQKTAKNDVVNQKPVVLAGNITKSKLSPRKVDWNNSGPDGLQVQDPRDFPVGAKMYESLLVEGLEPDLALTISRELLESGVGEPSVIQMKQGDKMYKVVPKDGGPPGENSPYFMDKDMLDKLPADTGEAGSALGLPQVPESFDVYEITAKSDVEIFQSEIAPFSVNGGEYLRSGGGTQSLVISRDKFTSPKILGD